MKTRYIVLIAIAIIILSGILYIRKLSNIPPPLVDDFSCTQWQREKLNDSLFIVGNNWLHQNRNGLWELYLEGNGFERGVAFGKLAQELLEYQEDAFVETINELVPSPAYLNFLRYFVGWFNRKLPENVPDEYLQEIYGVSLSASSKFDFIGSPYLRQLNYHAAHDIGHALQAMNMVACSSFSVWDNRSADHQLLVGRNFDFFVGDRFAKNKMVIFVNPDSGNRFVMIGWAGMCGVLSGMNEKGLTVTINAAKSDIPTGSATPISILAREILQYASTIGEAYSIAGKRKTFVSESLLIGSVQDGYTAIIEKSPGQMGLFTPSDNRIISTNHFQSTVFADDPANMENIRDSDSPYRYDRINELLTREEVVNEFSAASILRNTRGLQDKIIGYGNEKAVNQLIAHHAVIFKPNRLEFWVSTHPYQIGELAFYAMDSIFNTKQADIQKTSGYFSVKNIPADTLLFSKDYSCFLRYKQTKDSIKADIRGKLAWEGRPGQINSFIQSNPEKYDVYILLGDWYLSHGLPDKAIPFWEMALTKEIPRVPERTDIENKIMKYNNP